jgi:hypothetical protein
MHGLIFFYIQKFADVAAAGKTTWLQLRTTVSMTSRSYLPAGIYPDAEAVSLLASIADAAGEPVPAIVERFGEFLAPHLVKVAGRHVDPGWKTLDLIEHTESIIHTMIRSTNPGAEPPVLEAVRTAPGELQLVYSSARQLCGLARGLMKGIAGHYGEEISIDEHSCMHRGDPFCSFVVCTSAHETHAAQSPLSETIMFEATASAADGTTSAGGWRAVDHGPDRPAAGDPLPEAIAGCKVQRLIGHGGMGRVYLARDPVLERNVAIKLMHPGRAADPVARQRFLRESRATAAVIHPHVMTIHQVGEHAGCPYIIMQHVDGPTLTKYREEKGHLSYRESLRIGRQIAEGLAAAHAVGLVHRDVKPDNVLLEGSSHSVRIIDFGLARDIDSREAQLTLDGAVVGTPAYMSPERIGAEAVDTRSDLFGLGVILYELLADRLPFEGRSMVSILAAIARGMPPDLGSTVSDLPPEAARLVMQLIAHDPADRPASAGEVARLLAIIERQLPEV